MSRTAVIGVGNAWRGDDAAGLAVARRVGGIEHEGDCTRLVDVLGELGEAIVVDAAAAGGVPPGTVHRFDASSDPLPAVALRSSTHAFGVADAIELARALGRLPPRVRVYAIEGADFSVGAGLSEPVERAVARVAGDLVAAGYGSIAGGPGERKKIRYA